MSEELDSSWNEGDREYYKQRIKSFICINAKCKRHIINVDDAVDMPNGKCPDCIQLLAMSMKDGTKKMDMPKELK